MKSININYKVFNDKVDGKKIMVLTDLHDYPGRNNNAFIQDINSIESDLIIIAGDILAGPKYDGLSLSLSELEYFLNAISEGPTVVLGLGNHDLYRMTDKGMIGYASLEKARPGKVFPLNNESIVSNDTRVIEFHPRHSAFSPAVQESGRGLIEFCEDFEKYGIVPDLNSKEFNILICHNPKIFAQARSIGEQSKLKLTSEERAHLYELSQNMKRYDLGVGGHLHNGYLDIDRVLEDPSRYMDKGYWEMPKEKDSSGRVTMIRPWVFKKTDMCRGTFLIGDTEERIIELCDGTYYYLKDKDSEPIQITEETAMSMRNMTPFVISGGVNKFFNLPVDKSEITTVKVLKR